MTRTSQSHFGKLPDKSWRNPLTHSHPITIMIMQATVPFILLMCGSLVGAYPTGAPDKLCFEPEIVPDHKPHKPLEGRSAPYTVTASATKFTSEKDTITVTIQSKGDTKFKGFAIGAKDATTKKLIGRWDRSAQAHPLNCNTIITHNSNDEKTSVTLKWHPPKGTGSGNVLFSVAIVQKYSTYWKDVPIKTG